MAKGTVKVHVNRKLVELDTATITARDLAHAAGFTGDDWDVLRLQGEGDPTGGVRIDLDVLITLEPGAHFRIIPGNRNFG